jgi:glycosyltransferase involved in cell wall biosynthesis
MRSQGVSVVITVLNEEGTIRSLLESLLVQSRHPDEIVIVDGGSKDATTKIIREFSALGLPIKLIEVAGANIPRARNIAVGLARSDILAVTDAGCRLEPDWLMNIVRPMEEDPSIDVVSGAYVFYGESLFEQCVVATSWTPVESWKEEDFLPASRSVAFRRSAWDKVGGYPEYMDYGEDTLFDIRLKEAGAKFRLAKDAVVHYRVRPTATSLFKATYNYVKWDVVSGTYRRRGYFWVYIYLLFFGLLFTLTYMLGPLGIVIVSVLSILYLLRFGMTLAFRFHRPAALYHGMMVAGAMRLGEFLGLIAGMLRGRGAQR